jgi:ribonucleotide monophosphatase NagD (HAD superfamily)
MRTAKEFGAQTVLVLSGKERISQRNNWEFEPDYIFDNLLVAAHYLCAHYG